MKTLTPLFFPFPIFKFIFDINEAINFFLILLFFDVVCLFFSWPSSQLKRDRVECREERNSGIHRNRSEANICILHCRGRHDKPSKATS